PRRHAIPPLPSLSSHVGPTEAQLPPLAPSSFFVSRPSYPSSGHAAAHLLRPRRRSPRARHPQHRPPLPPRLFPGWPLLPAPLFSGRPLLSIARRGALLPGVEPPLVLTSLFPTPPARHRLGSSAALDRGPSPAASNSGGLELRRAGERAGPEQRAAAVARCDLEDDAAVVDKDAGGPPRGG
ncbi:unnamed protein product, partial [Urochloa humidicola]